MSTQTLIETYERHLAENWTPGGKKIEKPRRMGVIMFIDFPQEARVVLQKAVEDVHNTPTDALSVFERLRPK